MILYGLLLQPRAIFRCQPESLVFVVVLPPELLQQINVVFQQRFPPEGAFAVRPAFGVHLQQAQVHAQLYFLQSVFAPKFSDHHLARLVIPLVQQGRNIETHALNMTAKCLQVNVPERQFHQWALTTKRRSALIAPISEPISAAGATPVQAKTSRKCF
jgi:hypothetical protein